MELKTYFAQDVTGSVVASPEVELFLADGFTPAPAIFDATGEPLENPFTGSELGKIELAAPDGDYVISITATGRTTAQRVRFIDASGVVDALAARITLADLQSNDEGKGAALVGAPGAGDLTSTIHSVSAEAHGLVPQTDLEPDGQSLAPIDQADALEAAIAYAKAKRIPEVMIKGRGVIYSSRTIDLPIGITLRGPTSRAESQALGEFGEGLRICPHPAGEFKTATGATVTVAGDGHCQAGFLFFLNIKAEDPATWARHYPNVGSGGLRDMSIDGTPTGGISVAYFAGSHGFENIRLRKVATGFKKPPLYTDAIKIRHIFASNRANGTDYLIDLPSTGDALEISDVASGYTGNQVGPTRGVFVGLCRGGIFTNLVNGIHEFKNCHGRIEQPHIEGGQFIIDQGAMVLSGGKLFNGAGGLKPIVVRNSNSASLDHGSCTVENTSFIHYQNGVTDIAGWEADRSLDIEIEGSRMLLTIGRGNQRVITYNGGLTKQTLTAPIVGDANGPFPDWTDHAPMLASQGCTISNGKVHVSGTKPALESWNGIAAAQYAAPSGAGFSAPSATYYYSADLVIDPARAIGRSPAASAEVSRTVENGSLTLPGLSVDWGSNPGKGGAILRVYRGTAPGVYDKVAEIPVLNGSQFIDGGGAISGFVWQNRAAPGPKDALNNGGLNGPAFYTGGNLMLLGSAFPGSPAQGTWKKNDQFTVAGNSHHARLCTASGSVGTWVKLGILGAEKAAASSSTYSAASGGATIDAEARAALGKLAADFTDLRAKLATAGLQS